MSLQTHKTLFGSSSEHKLQYIWWNLRAFWPCIDRNGTDTFKAQKGSKDIVKIFHVTSVVQPLFYEASRIFYVRKEIKNNFIQQFLLFCVSLRCAFMTIPQHS